MTNITTEIKSYFNVNVDIAKIIKSNREAKNDNKITLGKGALETKSITEIRAIWQSPAYTTDTRFKALKIQKIKKCWSEDIHKDVKKKLRLLILFEKIGDETDFNNYLASHKILASDYVGTWLSQQAIAILTYQNYIRRLES